MKSTSKLAIGWLVGLLLAFIVSFPVAAIAAISVFFTIFCVLLLMFRSVEDTL